MTMPLTAVAGGNSQKVPAIVVDDVNDHTPDPATPPVVESLPDPPAPVDGLAELRDIVGKLAVSVSVLSEAVIGKHADESPTRVPWTHKGGHLPHEGE